MSVVVELLLLNTSLSGLRKMNRQRLHPFSIRFYPSNRGIILPYAKVEIVFQLRAEKILVKQGCQTYKPLSAVINKSKRGKIAGRKDCFS